MSDYSTTMNQFITSREQKTMERNPAVRPAGHGQVLPGEGGGDGGQQLHLLLGVQQRLGQQVVGRVREVGKEPL